MTPGVAGAPRLNGPIARARAALAWEALAPDLSVFAGLVLGAAVLAGSGLPALLPTPLHVLLLAALGFALAWSGLRALGRLRLPSLDAARRRVERDNGLAHRPLSGLADRPTPSGDPAADALWRAHLDRQRAALGRLDVAPPRAGILTDDRYGVRALIVILAVLVLAWSGDRLGERFLATLAPGGTASTKAAAIGFDLWLNPPSYTGAAPIYLGSGSPRPTAALRVPVGSTVLARVHGGDAARLRLDGDDLALGGDGGEFMATVPLGQATRLLLSGSAGPLADIAIETIPDQPPSAGFAGPIKFGPRGGFRVAYTASDDYGVTALFLSVRPSDGSAPPLDLRLPGADGARTLKSIADEDLTESDWAGEQAELTVIAADAIGQTAASAPLTLRLPERVFHDPTAQFLVALRKGILKRPDTAQQAAAALVLLLTEPARYHGDPAVFLALRTASLRLAHAEAGASHRSAAALLWSAALRLEDGATPEALKALRAAEQALREALDRNAPADEIAQRLHDFEQAMDRYIASLANQSRPGDDGPAPDRTISQDQLRALQQQLRDLARTGGRDAARDALARLEDLLESLRASRGGAAGQAQAPGENALRGVMRQQQDLMDKSYRAGQGGDGQKDGETGRLADRQGDLRKQLGDAMRQLGDRGDVPAPFAEADQAMRDAENALRQGDTDGAVAAEGRALERLRRGARELAERGHAQDGEQTGQGQSDPFGRPGNAIDNEGDVELPAQADVQRSRAILDELRRRAAEPARPRLERDYIDRLLDRF